MAGYSSRGTNKAYCDRCGFRFTGATLQREPQTHLLVCRDCYDEPRPRETRQVGAFVVRNPRPDVVPDVEPIVWDDPDTTIYWGKE